MCSIIGSYNQETFKKLVDINQHRGSFSYSFSLIKDNNVTKQIKNFGEFNLNIISNNDEYMLGHVQAPTNGLVKDVNRIHPTIIDKTMLWHNGILTPRGIKYLQNLLKTKETFDTRLLHYAILKYGFDILSKIEGLFSCVYLSDKIYMFRTKHGKLYIDDDKNLSSEKPNFGNFKCINYDTVYDFDLNEIQKFKTLRFNQVIPGDF